MIDAIALCLILRLRCRWFTNITAVSTQLMTALIHPLYIDDQTLLDGLQDVNVFRCCKACTIYTIDINDHLSLSGPGDHDLLLKQNDEGGSPYFSCC